MLTVRQCLQWMQARENLTEASSLPAIGIRHIISCLEQVYKCLPSASTDHWPLCNPPKWPNKKCMCRISVPVLANIWDLGHEEDWAIESRTAQEWWQWIRFCKHGVWQGQGEEGLGFLGHKDRSMRHILWSQDVKQILKVCQKPCKQPLTNTT